MQAIILAAGMGKRLKELTKDNTKCMVKVNGVALVDRLLHQLERKHLSRIVIVIGYEGQKLIDYIDTLGISTPITYVNNDIYDKTNNIYSLALAKDHLLHEDSLLFESDMIFEESVIDAMINDPRESVAVVDKYERWMDGTCVKLDANDNIVDFVPGKKFDYGEKDEYYKTVNVYKFSKHFSETRYVPFLEAYSNALGNNEYYEQVLSVIAMLDDPQIQALRLDGQRWYEIDDVQDLNIAESIFAEDDEKLALFQKRYGGYWRYPKLLDFCYLVNSYYPPKKLKDEMKASFDELLTQYPSGMAVNSLVAGKNFGVHQENIIVGNGAAELIKSLLSTIKGKVGVIRPTFEEYPNRLDAERTVVYEPQNGDYSYTVNDLKEYFADKGIECLIVINPDNPSGNYIARQELLDLVAWCAGKGIKLVVDESFVDFAEEDNTLIDQSIIDANRQLYVMKSISKSYGVPGARLGILVSGDTDTIGWMKKDVAIWNINSFGEYYLQIMEKYKKDYIKGIAAFRKERARLAAALGQLGGLRVVPSQANFLLVELVGGISSTELTKRLLVEHDIFIKDLSAKIKGGQYIRLAVRDKKDDDRLLEALGKILG
jgi:histidinol-phosphate/aromatic aminotransferase/cobyric acid decarboxylase-like protein/choline kinase